jgi:hypothetical protein
MRALVVVAVLGAVALTPQVLAAPPTVCNLVQDGSGDANASYVIGPNQPNAKAIDVISADVAIDKAHVGVGIRMGDVSQSNPHVNAGHGVTFAFGRAGAEKLVFRGVRDALGAWTWEYGHMEGTNERYDGTAQGVVDPARNEIRIWVAQAALGERTIPLGQAVVGPVVRTFDRAGVTQYQDSAPQDGTKSLKYVAGHKTCVPLGK